jgi:hypothetical protein
MKRKESDKITYIAPDGKKFGDLKEYMEYTETKFHNGKVVPGTVGQMFQSLRRYQDTDYVHGIVSIKEHNGNFNVQCFHTMNIENIVAPFTDVKQLNDDQKFVTATIADMKRVLNKFWDCQCTATVIVSPDRDFKSSQTFMMVNGYIMRTEPGKPNRETAATPAKGS